jgi:hypothetical protein
MKECDVAIFHGQTSDVYAYAFQSVIHENNLPCTIQT